MGNCDELVDRCFIMTGVREKCQTFKAACITTSAASPQSFWPCIFSLVSTFMLSCALLQLHR
jgi:hypothetical protein